MPETKDYVYQGNATLFFDRTAAASQEIRILEIEHMIPINVTCELDGRGTVLTAYIDYSTNRIHLPPDTAGQLDDGGDSFKHALVTFLSHRAEEEQQRHEQETQERFGIDLQHAVPDAPGPHNAPEDD